jgi:hypothetical protein
MVTILYVEVIRLSYGGMVSWKGRLSLYLSDWTCWMKEEKEMLIIRFLSILDTYYDDVRVVEAKRAWPITLPLKMRLQITRVCCTLPQFPLGTRAPARYGCTYVGWSEASMINIWGYVGKTY